jgi:hypothetical protein
VTAFNPIMLGAVRAARALFVAVQLVSSLLTVIFPQGGYRACIKPSLICLSVAAGAPTHSQTAVEFLVSLPKPLEVDDVHLHLAYIADVQNRCFFATYRETE